jgi:hypothetical protein
VLMYFVREALNSNLVNVYATRFVIT